MVTLLVLLLVFSIAGYISVAICVLTYLSDLLTNEDEVQIVAESHFSFEVRQLCFDLKTLSRHFVAFCRTCELKSEGSESEPNTPLKQVATVAKTEPLVTCSKLLKGEVIRCVLVYHA